MSNSETDSVWQFISEYKLEIDTASTNDNLTCGICKKLMIDACQTVCGCQYCHKCISEYLANEDKYCPGQKEDCKLIKLKLDQHVHKNVIMNTKIMSVKVRCPNPSCECNIVLTQMEDHLRLCTKQKTECPFVQIGCDNEGASKDVIVTHLQNETFTHSELLIKFIYNLKNEVDGLKDKSEISQFEISSLREELTLKDVQIEEIKLQMDIQKRVSEEQIWSLEKKFEKLRNEMEIRNREITVQMEEPKSEMEREIVESSKRESAMKTLEEEFGKLRNEAEIRKREMTVQMEEQNRELKRVKEDSNKRESAMSTLEKEIGKLRNKLEARSTSIIGCDKFPFVWRINECKTKMATMRQERIFSESFLSNGYKLCLSIYIGFNKDDIYLYCHIMRGDNDDQLHWPMRLKVRLSLVNQGTLSTHTSRTTKMETDKHNNKKVFNRPTTAMNEDGIQVTGSPFIKYSSIKDDRSVVLNDSIIISCIIGDPN